MSPPIKCDSNQGFLFCGINARRTVFSQGQNPTPHIIPEGPNATALEVVGATATDKLVIVMVGLPGCGKTGIAMRICRYLNFFLHLPTQIFDVGEIFHRMQSDPTFDKDSHRKGNNSFCHDSQITRAGEVALEDMVAYMRQDGVRVAVYDAPNETRESRKYLIEKLKDEGIGAKRIFLECICNDEKIIEENIRSKLSSRDYSREMDLVVAMKEFMGKRAKCDAFYESVDKSEGSYVQLFDFKTCVMHNIHGYLPLKVVHFVMNLHTHPRTFYLTRHGQSEYNVLGKIGGDSGLSKAGMEYARRLAVFAEEIVSKHIARDESTGMTTKRSIPARMWTSTLRRTKETSQFIKHPSLSRKFHDGDKGEWIQLRPTPRRNLDEIYAGVCDGMTYNEIERVYPEEFERRQKDKLAYRYPRGESYMDVMLRLEPLAHDMERTREPILIVGHQGILRILYAYFTGLNREEAPYVNIPLNTVIKLSPHSNRTGCEETRICLMRKEEMLLLSNDDGQDEPVTSMPTPKTVLGHSGAYPHNDLIMNSPCC